MASAVLDRPHRPPPPQPSSGAGTRRPRGRRPSLVLAARTPGAARRGRLVEDEIGTGVATDPGVGKERCHELFGTDGEVRIRTHASGDRRTPLVHFEREPMQPPRAGRTRAPSCPRAPAARDSSRWQGTRPRPHAPPAAPRPRSPLDSRPSAAEPAVRADRVRPPRPRRGRGRQPSRRRVASRSEPA